MSLLLAVLLLGQTVGKVVSITDGDTLIVRPVQGPSVKVRLIGIDAPERGQAFGTRARQELGELVAGKNVEVIGTTKDRYGRLLGDVRHDGRSINLEMIRRGFAWAYVEFDPPAEYVEAEAEARAARRGLWSDKSPIPPWSIRAGSLGHPDRRHPRRHHGRRDHGQGGEPGRSVRSACRRFMGGAGDGA